MDSYFLLKNLHSKLSIFSIIMFASLNANANFFTQAIQNLKKQNKQQSSSSNSSAPSNLTNQNSNVEAKVNNNKQTAPNYVQANTFSDIKTSIITDAKGASNGSGSNHSLSKMCPVGQTLASSECFVNNCFSQGSCGFPGDRADAPNGSLVPYYQQVNVNGAKVQQNGAKCNFSTYKWTSGHSGHSAQANLVIHCVPEKQTLVLGAN